MKKIIFIFFCVFIWFISLNAQTKIQFRGRVVDAKTSENLVYATIRLAGITKGIISNEKGAFIFYFDSIYLDQAIMVSYLGYSTYNIKALDIVPDSVYIIRLVPISYDISQVWIKAKNKINPRKIVRKAIRKIPGNYPDQSYQI